MLAIFAASAGDSAPQIFQWFEATAIGTAVRDSDWLFPFIESVHMLGIVALVGTSVLLDLRLLGRGILRHRPASQLASRALPVMWVSFAVMFVTGVLMFLSEATRCYGSVAFWVKMVLLAAVGLNAMVFQLGPYRKIAGWESAAVAPRSARAAAWVSLTLWVCIVVAGRGIAYW